MLVEETAERTRVTIERARAEAALREREEEYRLLFESIDEGFCVIEVLFDTEGKSSDYRFLEVNPAFQRQTGLDEATGRRMRELAPAHEEHWFEIYGRIALTGEPIRFEREAAALGRFDAAVVHVAISPYGRRVAAVDWPRDAPVRPREVRVWDVATKQVLFRSRPAPGPGPLAHGAVALSPDGTRVAFDDYAVPAAGELPSQSS